MVVMIMYKCSISDCGLSYQCDDIKTLLERLHEYIYELHGSYIVKPLNNDIVINSALEIHSTGDYFIQTSSIYDGIFCRISAV